MPPLPPLPFLRDLRTSPLRSAEPALEALSMMSWSESGAAALGEETAGLERSPSLREPSRDWRTSAGSSRRSPAVPATGLLRVRLAAGVEMEGVRTTARSLMASASSEMSGSLVGGGSSVLLVKSGASGVRSGEDGTLRMVTCSRSISKTPVCGDAVISSTTEREGRRSRLRATKSPAWTTMEVETAARIHQRRSHAVVVERKPWPEPRASQRGTGDLDMWRDARRRVEVQ